MPTVMVLLSEAPGTVTPIHVCSECPPTQRCHPRSSVSHCPVSVSCIQQCPLNGAARLDHQSTATSHPQCFTHTHTKCTMRNGAAIKGHQSRPRLVNSPSLYTMKGYITHRQPLLSHTNCPSSFTHARSKPLTQSSETNRSSNRRSPQHSRPVHSEQPAGAITAGLPQTDTHPMVSSRMPCTPLRVCAPPQLPNPGQHPHSLMSNVTVQAHPPPPPMVSPSMPCTPLRVCAPSSGFPIRANTIIH